MESNNKFSIVKRIKSFSYAFRGIWLVLRYEHNAWIHLLAMVVVTIFGFYFNLNSTEWCLIIFAIAMVIAAEMFNSAVEQIIDFVSPQFDNKAGKIKDIAAGAVLVCAISAATIGLIIFVPKLF